MSTSFTSQDRHITREIHKLFLRATLVDRVTLLIWVFTRPLSLLIYNILVPFQIAYAIQAIITRNFGVVDHHAWTIIGMCAVYAVLWAVSATAICRNGRIGTEYIQRKVFVNYLEKDYEFFSTSFLGSLGSQATQLRESYIDYCTLFMNTVAKQVIILTASIAIIAYHSLMLAAVTLCAIVLIVGFTIASSKWRLKYRRLLSEASSETAGVMSDALGHGATVKSFAAEEFEKKRLALSLKKFLNAQYWSWMSFTPAEVGRMLLASIGTVVLLVITARLFEDDNISIAIVVLVQLYVIRVVMTTQEIAETIKAYDRIMSGAHQAVKTMRIQPIVIDKPAPKKLSKKQKLDVVFQKVTYRYGDGGKSTAAIKDFDLHIAEGEKIGLVGYSGSGKTTLTKLLLRFIDVSSGTITIGGVDIRELAQAELRRHIAYVPQEPLLFHRSVRENIAYGKPAAGRLAIEAAAASAFVHEFTTRMAQGYETLVGEKGVKLSGGQRQRVAIARALLKDAPLLVLDEATSALDSRSEQYIQKALWRLMKGRTAIVIAHRLSTIQRMDRIVVMDKGSVVAVGTHQELLGQKNSIYAKLWSHQSGGYFGPSRVVE